MRIVFLAINASYSHMNLAGWCLKGLLRDGKAEWHLVEATINDDPMTVLERVVAIRPDVVAASFYLFNANFLSGVLARLRAVCRESSIIGGGPEFLGDNRKWIPEVVDVGVRGEGEAAFAEWITCVDRPEQWGGIPGLCYLDRGVYRDNGTAVALDGLDSIPPFYPAMLEGVSRPFVQLETSRGCTSGCLFCTSRRTRVRFKSLQRVDQDLHDIVQAGVNDVRIVDRTFNHNTDRSLSLLQSFREGYPSVRFHLEIDPALVSAPIAEALRLAPAGQLHLEIGVQSLEEAVHSLMERRGTAATTLEKVHMLCGMGNVECHVDLMSGLPGQTLQGLWRDVEALVRAGPGEIQLERLKLLPGTPLAATPDRWGLMASRLPPYEVLATSSMSMDDMATADRVAKVLDWFHNRPLLRTLFRDGVMLWPGFVEAFVAYCGERAGWAACPSLETRLKLLDGFWAGRSDSMCHRVRYVWMRQGYSPRHGVCAAEPWKGGVPGRAVLVEGDRDVPIARVWRAALEAPYYFCIGRGRAGERAVVAVYRDDGGRESAMRDGRPADGIVSGA